MFGATCERCLDTVYMTNDQADHVIGVQGEFLCDDCLEKPREWTSRKRPNEPKNWAREVGCIVTIRDLDGQLRSVHRSGQVFEALGAIISQLDDGEEIVSISTRASILHDVRNPTATTSDPWQTERNLLGKIGRIDLLGAR